MMWLRKPIQLTVHFLKIVGSFFTDVRVGFSLASFDSNTSPLNRIYTYKSLLHVKYFTFPIFRPKGRNSCPTADLNAYRCLGDEVQRTLCHGLRDLWPVCLYPRRKGLRADRTFQKRRLLLLSELPRPKAARCLSRLSSTNVNSRFCQLF